MIFCNLTPLDCRFVNAIVFYRKSEFREYITSLHIQHSIYVRQFEFFVFTIKQIASIFCNLSFAGQYIWHEYATYNDLVTFTMTSLHKNTFYRVCCCLGHSVSQTHLVSSCLIDTLQLTLSNQSYYNTGNTCSLNILVSFLYDVGGLKPNTLLFMGLITKLILIM